MLAYNNSNWAVVYQNMRKYWRRRIMVARILERTGARAQAWVDMYMSVAQLVLLYVSESWVVTREILKVLKVFHHQEAQWITGMKAKRGTCREWEYPSVVEEMKAAGLYPIKVYIKRRKKNIREWVSYHPIYKLCTEADWMPGTSWFVQWWDQDTVNEPEDYTRISYK